MRWFSYLVLFGILPVTCWSQSVSWVPAKGTFEKGVQSRLSLVFKDCDPSGSIQIPDVDGIQIGQPNSRRSHMSGFSSLLGGKGKTTTLGFPVVAVREGQVTIPSFRISTSKGKLEVAAARYQVVPATVSPQGGGSRQSQVQGPTLNLEDVAQAKIEYDRKEMWAGEVQQARLVFQGMSQYVQNFRGFEWDPEQLTLGPWLQHEEDRRVVNGNQVSIFEFPVRIQAPRLEGEYSIEPAQVGITVSSNSHSRSAFGIFRREGQQVTLEAEASDIIVKPLPASSDDFSGAVGEFSVSSQLVPEQTSVGEPITWTVRIQGAGNWNDVIRMPNRQVPEGFEVIQPKSSTEMEGDSIFIGKLIEDVVLIPTREGTFTIPGISFIYFDTKVGEYRTVTTADKTVVVEAAKSSVLSPGQPDGPGNAANPMPVSKSQVVPFDGQPQLPRDPLNQQLSSNRPFALPLWACCLLLPWAGVMGYWFWLAWKQVVRLDAGRSRREARKSLLQWNTETDMQDPVPAQLREWQREVERLWQVSRPVPDALRLRQVVEAQGADGDEWVWLWSSCERVLFGNQTELPSDWSQRFSNALEAVKLPRVKCSGFLKPQVWLPLFLCTVLTSSVLAVETVGNELLPDAGEVYQSGEFKKSEAALRLRLEEDWGDSAAHHDLALALWQQERWDEAAAYASIAALQSPGHEIIRWDVRLLSERAGWGTTATGRLFDERHALNRFITLRSVWFWQCLGILCSLVLAFLVVWGLTASYRKTGSGQWIRWGLAGLALIALIASLFCVERWGMLRHPETVVVVQEVQGRSIPSEVDQQTRPLPVGTVGFFKGQFLGWRKVMLPNREEVWVRENEVLPVYR